VEYGEEEIADLFYGHGGGLAVAVAAYVEKPRLG